MLRAAHPAGSVDEAEGLLTVYADATSVLAHTPATKGLLDVAEPSPVRAHAYTTSRDAPSPTQAVIPGQGQAGIEGDPVPGKTVQSALAGIRAARIEHIGSVT
ncbi:hypothetical protein [Streptomyces sp. NPDC048516]|uniref:hypothetical protein n=1 Tax=Streptomyces sp. NPDC048516 TaxID=3365565 RepID=UPI0037193912